ncbi:MAG: hypothetical protein WBE48_24210, partial [Xanthobacteraceae bacterium]
MCDTVDQASKPTCALTVYRAGEFDFCLDPVAFSAKINRRGSLNITGDDALDVYLPAKKAAPMFAATKPAFAPDQDTPLVVQSRVSAVLSFSVHALVEDLDREVPRRLASFDDQLTTCGHRRGFFRRQVDIKCVVTGYIERTAPIYLRAEGNRV